MSCFLVEARDTDHKGQVARKEKNREEPYSRARKANRISNLFEPVASTKTRHLLAVSCFLVEAWDTDHKGQVARKEK